MRMHPLPYRMDPEDELKLVRRLRRAEAEQEPVVLEIGGERYRLVPEEDIQITDDPAAHYDPKKALAAIHAGAGAFKGIDVDAFLTEIMEARDLNRDQLAPVSGNRSSSRGGDWRLRPSDG